MDDLASRLVHRLLLRRYRNGPRHLQIGGIRPLTSKGESVKQALAYTFFLGPTTVVASFLIARYFIPF